MYHFKKSTKSFSKKFGTEVCLSHSCLSVLRPDECFQVVKNLDCRRISSACLRFVHVCHETAKCLNSNISMFYFAFQGAVTRRFWGFLLTEVVFMGSYTQRHTHAMDLLDFLLCQVSRHHSQDEDQSCRGFSHWKCK